MKQFFILFIALLTILSGCKDNATQVEVKGEIKGMGNDTILLYANDELSDFIDTVYVANDKFSWSMKMDTTLIEAMLVINGQDQYPVYLERGKSLQIKGDVNTPGLFDIKGNDINEEFTALNKTLPQPTTPNDTLTIRLVEEHIRQNQKSLINIYLLDKYFVQTTSPNLSKIKELIGLMDGSLQDKPYIEKLTKLIEESESSEVNKTAPLFTLTNPEGKRISRSDFRDRYMVLTFWASWCDSCRSYNNELKKIYKTYPPKSQKERDREKEKEKKDRTYKISPELAIVGISLDMDKKEWKETIKQDTLKWEQLNDFLGWNSTVIKQYAIKEIPYNILIDSKGKIIARGINGEELSLKLDSLLKQN